MVYNHRAVPPNDASIKTLQRHIAEQQRQHPTATGEFSWLLSGITLATKIIAAQVRRIGLGDLRGATGTIGIDPRTGYRASVPVRILRVDGRKKFVIA